MHTPSNIGPLSPIGHPLSPATSLLSHNSESKSKSKSGRRRSSSSRRLNHSTSTHSKLRCSVCLESLDPRAFARPQRMKEHTSTCRSCVWKALARNNYQEASPGLTSSSSSLSSYSEGPTWNLPIPSPLRSQTTTESVQNVPEEIMEDDASVGTVQV